MTIFEREILDAFDDALSRVPNDDYYPDQRALAAYARAKRVHLPLTGNAYLAFKHTNHYRKQYRELNPEQRCSLILSQWNEENPERLVEDPFASDNASTK